jgi:hypothetical protein
MEIQHKSVIELRKEKESFYLVCCLSCLTGPYACCGLCCVVQNHTARAAILTEVLIFLILVGAFYIIIGSITLSLVNQQQVPISNASNSIMLKILIGAPIRLTMLPIMQIVIGATLICCSSTWLTCLAVRYRRGRYPSTLVPFLTKIV